MPATNVTIVRPSRRVLFVMFSGVEGGPQAWFSQLEARREFRRAADARVWKPGDLYRGVRGKFRLLAHCREKYMAEGNPSIVYVSLDLDFAAQIVLCLWLAGARNMIVHAHATHFGSVRSVRTLFYKWLVRVLAKRKAAVSEESAWAMFGQGLDRVVLLPAFIDFAALKRSAERPPSERPIYPGPKLEDRFTFACVGRLAESKNVPLAIEAFARLKKKVPDLSIELLLIGSGPEEQLLERLCNELQVVEYVHVTGWVDNIAWYLRHVVDCVLMPSLHEGAPRAVLEAQGFGCSVIASSAVPEFCLFREDLAVRLPDLECETWANEMGAVAERGQKIVGDSIERARRHPLFSIDHGIKAFLDLLEPNRT